MMLVARSCVFGTRLSTDQSRFLQRWRMAGGANASAQALFDEDESRLIYCVKQDGAWRFEFVGDEHHARNGVRLEGRLDRVLSDEAFQRARNQHNRVASGTSPYRFEVPGMVGFSRHLWTERISVPVSPPYGSERAVLSHYHWRTGTDPAALAIVRDALIEQFGTAFSGLLESAEALSPQMLIEFVRSLKTGHDPFRGSTLCHLFEQMVFTEEQLPS